MATTATSAPPPLERIIPYVISGISVAVSIASSVASFAKFCISLVTRSISFFSPLPIILYLFAPLIVFLDIVSDIFIRWPRSIVLYLLDAFYPVYVFCGVACIVGVLVGSTGRLVTQVLVDIVAEKEDQEPDAEVEAEVRKHRIKKRPKVEDD
ncbi:hypothetical protein H2248_002925 [Termitomyces sp. 'cryptogamus']|nr:hypothetical protein H2248_002925 [Termitomyces sp. 'cryptogamus']